jgi:hypothetical protein
MNFRGDLIRYCQKFLEIFFHKNRDNVANPAF